MVDEHFDWLQVGVARMVDEASHVSELARVNRERVLLLRRKSQLNGEEEEARLEPNFVQCLHGRQGRRGTCRLQHCWRRHRTESPQRT